MVVLGPLLHIKNNNLPRGVRKIEAKISNSDFEDIKATIPNYSKSSLLESLEKAVLIYRQLRRELYTANIILQLDTEKKVMEYFDKIRLLEK
jgi:hypothetical protein